MQDKEIQELINKINIYAKNADVSLVEKAYYFGKKAHDGQFRKSGEPYFIHPVAVAITAWSSSFNALKICLATTGAPHPAHILCPSVNLEGLFATTSFKLYAIII